MDRKVPRRHIARFAAAVLVAPSALASTPVPLAFAEPCPDAEIVFARGTNEPPGVGGFGQDFVDALRAKMGTKSLGVYPVNYPATTAFVTALDGIDDASAHIQRTAAACPKTKMVLGGFSQGAAVMGFVTANAIPDGAPEGVPNPMPAEAANHVAAVALFGKPSAQFMRSINQPPITIGPLYADKTIELCTADDPVCSDGGDWAAHNAYSDDGMIERAADFVISHL
ncbi:MAG: cutinase family protein [Mycobacteriaceae bacterium]|nr:cutinase family protein [Mycobacteriaceae bacterium]